ncbi:MAG: hypothetical protein AAFP89_05755 [Bacteroidota bacterium]
MKNCIYFWIILLISGCTSPMFEDFSDPLPKVAIRKVEGFSVDSTRIEIEVLEEGVDNVRQVGFVYRENETPTIEDPLAPLSETQMDTAGIFTANYLNREGFLEPGKTYILRAYAENRYGVSLSEPVSYTVAEQITVQPPCILKENTITWNGTDYGVRGISIFQNFTFQYSIAVSNSLLRIYFTEEPVVGQYETVAERFELDSSNQVFIDLRVDPQSSDPAVKALAGATIDVYEEDTGDIILLFCELELPGAFDDPIKGSITID